MTPNYDSLVVLRIAKAYYLDGQSQQEISDREKIHRSQISRILKLAREKGYVQIRITPPRSETAEFLAEEVRKVLDIPEVLVAPVLSSSPSDPEETLCFFAARYLEELLPLCRHIGIGIGKTLYKTASQLTSRNADHPLDFYSIVGSSGTDNPFLQSSIILDSFSRAFEGRCHYNNFPICIYRDRMNQLDRSRLSEMRQSYRILDAAVFSIGGPLNMDYPYMEEFSFFGRDIDTTSALARPHGNLLGHVFYDDHEELILPEEVQMTSLELSVMETLPRSVCIAGGFRKTGAIISAARQKYFKTLITDEATAREILKLQAAKSPESLS